MDGAPTRDLRRHQINLKMQVDASRCAGCGHCLEVCPTGAIRLVDGVAAIDAPLCQGCQACLEACPNGAILAVEEVTEPVLAPAQPLSPPASQPVTRVLPVLGTALAFVGREIVPRVVAALLERGERERTEPLPASPSRSFLGQGRRWRWRRRGRH